ncbi:Serine/threonine-protein kinase nak1 [Cladobotryum mycophilum]|uniref:non-specific serine/threonine protein kinase n=1 Tax=Cladobotryum mycophilum TaxID=491253 RepID=A0ABR0SCQ8_9HYPO
MLSLQFPDANYLSESKQKAIEDARTAQAIVVKECAEANRNLPPYELQELIGKGSFGRVYKASGGKQGQTVAVKVISIEDGDTVEPRGADTLSDVVKEVNTLKALSNSGAKNINAVVDTLLVGHSVWMVTEYCAGGSVASLMRPTSGLAEKWIIPILREVAEALYWVHKQGIIHRDIKCANVLITEAGGVQLCDFGVAGIMETKFDKRHTVTGTLHWMAPELFDSSVAYGSEVDIWAFGSMAYEIASGLPPNATQRINIQQFGSYLKQYTPRLEGDQFSDRLKDIVAFCLVEDPSHRPPIEDIQNHPYIFDTDEEYPTVSLSKLVTDYKLWEAQGGSRQSLFSAGGAQGPSRDPSPCRLSGWEFSGFAESNFDDSNQLTLTSPGRIRPSDVHDSSLEDTPTQSHRRRRPPPNTPELKAPLEKIFDPHTLSKYDDNSRAFYGKITLSPVSEAPVQDSESSRDSLIDLDAAERPASIYIDMDTIKPALRPLSTDFSEYIESTRRRTQDWTFPGVTSASTTSSIPGMDSPRYNFMNSDMNNDMNNEDSLSNNSSPPAEPYQYADSPVPSFEQPPNRDSSLSLIDLDACLLGEVIESGSPTQGPYSRYSGSVSSSAALHFDYDSTTTQSPSLYIDSDMDSTPSLSRQHSGLQSTPTTPGERSDIQWASSGLGILQLDDLFSSLPPCQGIPPYRFFRASPPKTTSRWNSSG